MTEIATFSGDPLRHLVDVPVGVLWPTPRMPLVVDERRPVMQGLGGAAVLLDPARVQPGVDVAAMYRPAPSSLWEWFTMPAAPRKEDTPPLFLCVTRTMTEAGRAFLLVCPADHHRVRWPDVVEDALSGRGDPIPAAVDSNPLIRVEIETGTPRAQVALFYLLVSGLTSGRVREWMGAPQQVAPQLGRWLQSHAPDGATVLEVWVKRPVERTS